MSGELFVEVSIVFIVAWLIASLLRFLKQPMIIGYLFTGIIVGPIYGVVRSNDSLAIFSEMGIAFLLFTVGLNLNPRLIREVGATALVAGLTQVALTFGMGFGIAWVLGFNAVTSLYIGLAVTFSSTIIVMKLLSDRNDLETLHGRLITGILLLQDMVVIFVLIALGTISGNGSSTQFSEIILSTLLKLISLGAIFFVAYKLFPKIDRFLARSQEYLFIFSIGWCFTMAGLFVFFGFPLEIGALLAGVSLSLSPFHYEISAKVKTLRDFFLILFFVFLGSQMVVADVRSVIIPALILSAFVLIIKPFIIVGILGFMGYSKKNNFLTGTALAQISEFSLIIVALAMNAGHVGSDILTLVTMVGIISILGSAYFIKFANRLFIPLAGFLRFFEKKGKRLDHHGSQSSHTYEIILFGYNRIGFDLLSALRKSNDSYLLVDYNPDTIMKLAKQNVDCKYGDATDPELLNQLNLGKAKMVISTIPDIDTNLLIINKIHVEQGSAIIIVVAHQIDDALKMYEEGATYVLMPHFLGGKHIATMLENYQFDVSKFLKEQVRHIDHLKKRKQMGHEHPRPERDR